MTVWPGVALPPRPVDRYLVGPDDDENLIAVDSLEPRALPDEWVFRVLADADLEDYDAVWALLNEYGPIRDRPYHRWWEPRGDPEDMINIEDARWWLKTARALAGTWSRASRGEDPADAWLAEGLPVRGDDRDPWFRFTVVLNEGLEPFHAQAIYDAPGYSGYTSASLQPVDLYSAACLQVFGFMVEGHTARHCENATCGRTFVHQLGGARFHQHRSVGLRYCSPACARAQASREYRRRKAARKEQP
jgi:hypothetical protein